MTRTNYTGCELLCGFKYLKPVLFGIILQNTITKGSQIYLNNGLQFYLNIFSPQVFPFSLFMLRLVPVSKHLVYN